MSAKQLDDMVKALRAMGRNVPSRGALEYLIYDIADALWACDKKTLALSVRELANEIDDIDTDELVKVGTFM